jgi:hypothetical protein
MSNLTTLNNQFEFTLSPSFIPERLEKRYLGLLGAKRKLYRSVIDYINSSILTITMPSFTMVVASNPQVTRRKEIQYKAVGNVYDMFDKSVTITFKNVDSNLNYLMMLDILTNHYLNTKRVYDDNIVVTVVDENRSALYHIQFREVIFTGLSDNTFAYNDAVIGSKTFTMTFTYNFLDIEFVKDKVDIISGNNYQV